MSSPQSLAGDHVAHETRLRKELAYRLSSLPPSPANTPRYQFATRDHHVTNTRDSFLKNDNCQNAEDERRARAYTFYHRGFSVGALKGRRRRTGGGGMRKQKTVRVFSFGSVVYTALVQIRRRRSAHPGTAGAHSLDRFAYIFERMARCIALRAPNCNVIPRGKCLDARLCPPSPPFLETKTQTLCVRDVLPIGLQSRAPIAVCSVCSMYARRPAIYKR